MSACTSSSPPTGILIATSSGSSENQPTSLTTSGFPSESARIAAPDVSPIVGARRSTIASHAAINAHSRSSSTYGSRMTPVASSPVRSMRPARSNPGDSEPTTSRRAPCRVRRSAAKASSSWGTRLFSLMCPKLPTSGDPATDSGATGGTGHAGCAIRCRRPGVAVLTNERLDVPRVHDHARRAIEHLSCERELLRPNLPQRRHAALEHAIAEQARRNTGFPLHRSEVGVPVVAADGEARDEMMDDEVVQHDDAGTPAKRVDDPPVRIGIVAYVVERDVGVGDGTRATGAHHLDLDEPFERRKQQRRIVGDARRRRRQR